jgi:DNA-directed RNA polymerase subunit RPC12/RpoP
MTTRRPGNREPVTNMEKLNEEKCLACKLGPPDWIYSCGECGAKFNVPVPKGPSEEKEHACPKCRSKKIKRIDMVKSEACAPGG